MCVVGSVQATILVFDKSNIPDGNGYEGFGASFATPPFTNVPTAYGDNVTATIQGGFHYGVGSEGFTPNIVADYGSGTTAATILYGWGSQSGLPSGFGDLKNVAGWESDGLRVTLTSSLANEPVRLLSFDLGAWDTDRPNTGVQVLDGASQVLYSSTVTVPGYNGSGGHVAFDFTGSMVTGAVVRIQLTDPSGGYIAIDNIAFAQIPEPSALGLLLTAGMGLLWRRRRWPASRA
jgi:hypothetical protein